MEMQLLIAVPLWCRKHVQYRNQLHVSPPESEVDVFLYVSEYSMIVANLGRNIVASASVYVALEEKYWNYGQTVHRKRFGYILAESVPPNATLSVLLVYVTV